MKKLKPNEQIFWEEYLSTLSNHPLNPFVEACYCWNKEITDGLLALYLLGKKTASSGLMKDYESVGDPLPKTGNYWILLDSADNPRCILKTVEVVFNKFDSIPSKIAQAEGEGDYSIEYWKRVHSKIFAPYLKKWGIDCIEDAEVVTEFFEVVYKRNESK